MSDSEKQHNYTLKSSFSSKGTPSKQNVNAKDTKDEAPLILMRVTEPIVRVDRSHRINISYGHIEESIDIKFDEIRDAKSQTQHTHQN